MIHSVSIGFTSKLVDEGSWGGTVRSSEAYNTMTFTAPPRSFTYEARAGSIVWETSQDDYNEIGIWLDYINGAPELIDYDGTMSIPHQAVELLRAAGIVVPKDFE